MSICQHGAAPRQPKGILTIRIVAYICQIGSFLILASFIANCGNPVPIAKSVEGIGDSQVSRLGDVTDETIGNEVVQGIVLSLIGEGEYQAGKTALFKLNAYNSNTERKYLRILVERSTLITTRKKGKSTITILMHGKYNIGERRICIYHNDTMPIVVLPKEDVSFGYAAIVPKGLCEEVDISRRTTVEQDFLVFVTSDPDDCGKEESKWIRLAVEFNTFCKKECGAEGDSGGPEMGVTQ